ncbi:MAG: serine kinase [Calditrichaeota bacterium]|nr:MAG: serine kinase [Calditrichota bacterium]
MELTQIVNQLQLDVLSGGSLNGEIRYGYISDILSDVMAKSPKSALWITNQTHENILALVYFKGLAGVILPEGQRLDESLLMKAQQKNIPVFSSKQSAFDLAGQLYGLGIRGRM